MDKPYLCGGTFFVLLLQAKKRATKKRNKALGGNDGLTEPNMLLGLIRVAAPQFEEPAGKSFKSSTSAYKSCQDYTNTYLPFNDPAFVDDFDRQITNSYSEALLAMQSFVDRYVEIRSKSKREQLVHALLELIDNDDGIDDSDEFFINSDGTAVRKAALKTLKAFDFQPFLLGVWHYIVKNRPDNIRGRETFEDWHKKPTSPNSPWKFSSNIGRNYDREIKVDVLNLNVSQEDASTSPDTVEQSAEKSVLDQNEPQKVILTNTSDTMVNQTGSKNVNTSRATNNVKLTYNAVGTLVNPLNGLPFNSDYYNLFVLCNTDLSTGYFVMQKDRAPEPCYTRKEIWERYAPLTPEVVEEIKTFPAIITNESTGYGEADENQLAICAAITDMRLQENGVKVHFQPLFYLPQNQLIQIAEKLALRNSYELNHTHWAIKNMNLGEELFEAKNRFIPLEALSVREG